MQQMGEVMRVEFRVLGVVEAHVDGQLIDIGHARQRSVLAALLVEVNRTIPTGRLADRIWGEHVPRSAESTIYSYISRLRRALRPSAGVCVRTSPGGYVLAVDPATVDVHRFRDLIKQARAAEDDDRAISLFDEALGLWRGEPFSTLNSPWLNGVRSHLTDERLAAELERDDLRLRRGEHAVLLSDLWQRVADRPLDERAAAQLVLALYRAGRQAEALRVLQDTRRTLADELGIEPGPDLRELQERILHADPGLTVRRAP